MHAHRTCRNSHVASVALFVLLLLAPSARSAQSAGECDSSCIASELLTQLTQLRRKLHTQPELSGHEVSTAETIAAWLRDTGSLEVRTGVGGHGVLGIWNSGREGPTTLLRCELDGLPIVETAQPGWRSKTEGLGHMCGHDGQMAIIAGVARSLASDPPAKGRVVLLFQPAEETGTGARAVLGDPQFASIKPDYAFALHNLPGLELGIVKVKEGPFNFASTGLLVELKGWTSHAAHPEDGRSPANAAAELIKTLPSLPSRLGMAPDRALVTLTHAQIGELSYGISPGTARVIATIRAETDALQEGLVKEATAVVESIAEKEGLRVTVSTSDAFAATTNDEAAVQLVRRACASAGVEAQSLDQPFRWSEDFGVYGASTSAALFVLGAGVQHPQLHNPDYDFPDDLINIGILLFNQIVRHINN